MYNKISYLWSQKVQIKVCYQIHCLIYFRKKITNLSGKMHHSCCRFISFHWWASLSPMRSLEFCCWCLLRYHFISFLVYHHLPRCIFIFLTLPSPHRRAAVLPSPRRQAPVQEASGPAPPSIVVPTFSVPFWGLGTKGFQTLVLTFGLGRVILTSNLSPIKKAEKRKKMLNGLVY